MYFDKYHLNTVRAIKFFPIELFMSSLNFPCLAILFYRWKSFCILDMFSGSLKETIRKNWVFSIYKEGEK